MHHPTQQTVEARELQLLSSREVSRGSLAPGRVDAAQKSGQWSLSLEQNQAEVGGFGARRSGKTHHQKVRPTPVAVGFSQDRSNNCTSKGLETSLAVKHVCVPRVNA